MHWTACPAADTVNILITLAGMLREIYPSPEHAPDVRVSLVEPLLHDRIDKRRTMEEHPFVALVRVLLGHFMSAVTISFP